MLKLSLKNNGSGTIYHVAEVGYSYLYPIYQPLRLRKDMTQGQFLSGV